MGEMTDRKEIGYGEIHVDDCYVGAEIYYLDSPISRFVLALLTTLLNTSGEVQQHGAFGPILRRKRFIGWHRSWKQDRSTPVTQMP